MQRPVQSTAAVIGELAVLALLCAATGAWPVPDVNETVYLTKARHAADPDFGRGDFFLETPDGHGLFFRLFGALAAGVPLESAAWVGRWAGWLAVAVGAWSALRPLLPSAAARIAAGALFALALRQTTAAGEWVLGGCEAKVFAWGFVLAAAGVWARGRFSIAWALAGAGTALHPLVGGWAQVALVLAAWWSRGELPPWKASDVAWLGAGVAAAAVGVVPALGLTAGAEAAERIAATRIYVVERLPHHLLPRSFADGLWARHVLAVCVWLLLRGRLPSTPAWRRSDRLTLAALAISAAGVVVSLAEPLAPAAVYGLLRYYFFRLADVLVPLSLAATVAAVLADRAVLARLVPLPVPATRALAALLLAADLAGQSAHWPLPGRSTPAPRADARVDAPAWRDACRWVAANVPAGARFLTPRGAASFTWFTGRAEVVGWKNSPQDVPSLLEWRRRMIDCYSRDGSLRGMVNSTAELGRQRAAAAAARYGATHAIVPVDVPGIDDFGWDLLHRAGVYAVYRIPAGDRAPSPHDAPADR